MNGAISQPLESAARRVVTVQGWASLCLLLAVPLLIASSIFITFFAHDEWRQAGIAWAVEEGQLELARAISEGSFGGKEWSFWAAAGLGVAGVLLYLWWVLRSWAVNRIKSMPGLAGAVRDERDRRNQEKWKAVGLALVIFLIPLLIASAFSHSGHHHGNDCDDWWDD